MRKITILFSSQLELNTTYQYTMKSDGSSNFQKEHIERSYFYLQGSSAKIWMGLFRMLNNLILYSQHRLMQPKPTCLIRPLIPLLIRHTPLTPYVQNNPKFDTPLQIRPKIFAYVLVELSVADCIETCVTSVNHCVRNTLGNTAKDSELTHFR